MGLELLRDAVVSIISIAAIFAILYVYLTARHRERMAILDKGLATSPFPSTGHLTTLKYGLFMVGVAIGFVVGWLLEQNGMPQELGIISMIFLFGGLSLITSFLIIRNLKP